MKIRNLFFSVSPLLVLGSCKKKEPVCFTIYKATGNILPELNRFRNQPGQIKTLPGQTEGRREINWDGVPDSLLHTTLPHDFFNPVGNNAPASMQRGLLHSDGQFHVSASGFSHINPEAATEFPSFSGNRSFANTGNLSWPIDFEVPGQSVPASVSAFGIVFSDDGLEQSTALEFLMAMKAWGNFTYRPRKPRHVFLSWVFISITIR